jgi:hypothetical protein
MRWTFDCAMHKDYGFKGWKLTNMPAFDPVTGLGVAHDILEHRRNDDSTTGELMALGAMIHVRGEDYFYRKNLVYTSPSYHLYSELGDLMLKIQSGEWTALRPFPRQYSRTDDDWTRAQIAEGISLAEKYIREDREEELPSADQWRAVRNWITYGFNSARQRYRDIARHDLLETFCEIEQQADNALRYAEAGLTQLTVNLAWRAGYLTNERKPDLSITTREVYV